ncbi:embryonic polarity protein dorsal isoform B [Bombyx mori]|uniref:BmRelA n=2 Tax=Bombyx mori TaxID=7091 RepID=Q4H4G7_BOMMO|nr:embryonic polarity protein dorsal isoform B [Bombyx mori]BAE16275.1 BmRelA [Bombyx mori]
MDIGGDAGLPIGIAEQNDPNQPNELNINDVFEAISLADPTFGEGPPPVALENMASQSAPPRAPSVVIVEQPASKALRFRYKCEGRSAGSLPGVSSTPENKTYPTIKICSYKGPATIVVSCVNKDPPFKPHPHNLVGRERCDRGVCSVRTDVTEDNNEYQFRNLGIQCVKRKDIVAELRLREELRVDPFRTGFDHRSHTQSIDLNAVRLAFQVFVPDGAGRMRRPLPTVVSDIIYDKKAMSDLLIMRSSHCSGTIRGGTQVILLCEKVSKEDTAVIFYQEVNEQIVWEETVTPSYVHKQVAVVFNTPPYRDPQRDEHVTVHFQLKRLTDDARSNSFAFEYIPDFRDSNYILGKKRKTKMPLMAAYEQERTFQEQMPIKAEPREKSPHHATSPYGAYPPYSDPNWMVPPEQMRTIPDLAVPAATNMDTFADMAWSNVPYGQGLQPLQPGANVMHSPHSLSPMHRGQSVSPMQDSQCGSPMHGGPCVSPMHGGACVSPMVGPMMQVGSTSPNMQHNTYSHLPQGAEADGAGTTFSAQFLDREPILNSSEFRSLLGGDGNMLSADLNKLSTSDLLL